MSETGDHEPLIHARVARHAASRPSAPALVCGERRISYETLEAAASAYAGDLADRGVGPGQVIPVALPRSARLVAIQLAILKCGAAYASVDPRWPASRLRAVFEHASPVLVVSDGDGGRFPAYRPPSEDLYAAAARAGRFDPATIDGSAPAMVFFTSGTTGRPKGVVSPHRAVTRLFRSDWLGGFGPGHAMPQEAPAPWDMYAFELWGPLTTGGTSVLVDGNHLLPSTLRDLIRTSGVDRLFLTTSLFNLFVDEDPGCFSGLGLVLTGGEKVSPEHIRLFLQRHPDIPLHNGYGPAESCMVTSAHLIRAQDCALPGGIPIGSAVPATRILILDPDDQQCQAGERGEICIAGEGLAVCYLGNAELTAAKFPTVVVDGVPLRIYRTGDFGVMDQAGVLHFAGREDRQVKISGYRVELAEIEAAARSVPDVRECVAFPLADPSGQVSRLALFYLSVPGCVSPEEAGANDPLKVREQLSRQLPGYMVPGAVRWLARFPVTANGKLDRAALQQMARRPAPVMLAAAGVPANEALQ